MQCLLLIDIVDLNSALEYILWLAMRMRNMRFMRIMREYVDADENLIHIIYI